MVTKLEVQNTSSNTLTARLKRKDEIKFGTTQDLKSINTLSASIEAAKLVDEEVKIDG